MRSASTWCWTAASNELRRSSSLRTSSSSLWRARWSPRHDQIDLETHQIGRHVRESLGVTFRRPVFDHQVLPFDVAEFPQALTQRVQIGGIMYRRYRFQNPDSIDLPRLLCTRYER